MSFRLIILALASSVLMFSPAHAEDELVGTTAADVMPSSAMEERIRAYRESYDRTHAQAEKRREEAVARHQSMREQHESQAPVQQARVLSEREKAMMRFRQEQRAIYEKQLQEREALASKWREARQKFQEARMDTYLKQREEQLASMEKQQEAMRNRAEDQHNYLVENQDEIMQGILEKKVEIANRHEELRKQADERRKKMAAMRVAMEDMTPQERSVYMQEHQAELFGPQGNRRPNMRPNMRGGQGRPPSPPPWMRQAPASVPPVPQP